MASMGREDIIRAAERPHLIVLRGPSLGDFFALEGEALVLTELLVKNRFDEEFEHCLEAADGGRPLSGASLVRASARSRRAPRNASPVVPAEPGKP